MDSAFRTEQEIAFIAVSKVRQREFSKDLWPVHLKPKDDELLSSWLARLAISHGLAPQDIFSFFPFKYLPDDSDFITDEKFFKILSGNTGVSIATAKATTLKAYEWQIYQEYLPYWKGTPWLLLKYYGNVNRNESFNLQFCPYCLAEDDSPYFRRIWRLAFVVICNKHNTLLLDRCMKCGKYLDLFKTGGQRIRNYSENLMVSCQSCNSDLRYMTTNSPHGPILQEELEFQESLIRAINQGWVEVPRRGYIYSHLYFEGLHKLLEFSVLLHDKACEHYKLPAFTVSFPKRTQRLEFLSTNDRRGLLRIAGRFLDDWPWGFINFWKVNNLPGIHYIYFDYNEQKELPFWFLSVFQDYLTEFKYIPSEEELLAELKYTDKDLFDYWSHRPST